jgi:hypothetical protein
MNTVPYYSQEEIEKLRNALYANSPFDLGSTNDNKYRDAIDETLGEPNLCTVCHGTGIKKLADELYIGCAHCRQAGIEPVKKG